MSMAAEFERFETLDDLTNSLTKALIDKSVFKWSVPEDFNALYTALEKLSGSDDPLRVIATLGRTEAAVKKPVFDLDKAASLLPEAPDLNALKDGDDRYYAAQFIRRLSPVWLVPWALGSIWDETGSEKSRAVFVEIVVQSHNSFDSILVEIGKAGQNYIKGSELTEVKVTGRFLRVIKSLRNACQSHELNFGNGVGKSLDSFFGAPFAHFTTSETKSNVRKSLVPEVVGLLLDLIGKRFSLAIENEYYAVLKRTRKWCDDEVWEELSANNSVFQKLSDTIAEALLILARQNIADGELLMRLKESVTSDQQYTRLCDRIAKSGHLDESIATWLMTGGQRHESKKTISSDSEVATKAESTDLGDLLLRVDQGQMAFKAASNAIDDLELFDPSMVPVIKDIANHWTIVSEITEKLAHKREISLVGQSGSRVDIDRKLYDVAGDSEVSQRYGIVVRPAVIISNKGKTQIIKKGVVKSIED